jgi:hypothetical protein
MRRANARTAWPAAFRFVVEEFDCKRRKNEREWQVAVMFRMVNIRHPDAARSKKKTLNPAYRGSGGTTFTGRIAHA